MNSSNKRRSFIKRSAAIVSGATLFPFLAKATPVPASPTDEQSLYMIGPQEGYSPRIGTLLSTMTMMREWIIRGVRDLTVEQLDWQIDDQSNSIGAMLLHLAATERYYQLNTFEGMPWGTWSDEIKAEWDIPMSLGAPAREAIKGHEFGFYEEKLREVRAITEAEFAKRDDDWLMESEPFFDREPTNNHCKWFHVCEHESNHNGQIKFLKKRMPG